MKLKITDNYEIFKVPRQKENFDAATLYTGLKSICKNV